MSSEVLSLLDSGYAASDATLAGVEAKLPPKFNLMVVEV